MPAPPPRIRRRMRWSDILISALGGMLVSLGIGLAIDASSATCSTAADWLGWVALGAARSPASRRRRSYPRGRRPSCGSAASAASATPPRLHRPPTTSCERRAPWSAIWPISMAAPRDGEEPRRPEGACRRDHRRRPRSGLAERELLASFDTVAKSWCFRPPSGLTVVTAIAARRRGRDLRAHLGAAADPPLGQLYGGQLASASCAWREWSSRPSRRHRRHGGWRLAGAAGARPRPRWRGLSARLGEGVINGILTARIEHRRGSRSAPPPALPVGKAAGRRPTSSPNWRGSTQGRGRGGGAET